MNNKKLFTIIIIIALLLRLTFAFIIPIFEKPDEQAHFEYIQFIVDNKELPIQGNEYSEFFQPPLYYIFTAFILAFIQIFTIDIAAQVVLIRLISVIISLFTLFIVFKIARLLFNNRNLQFSILIFASFLPSMININSSVSNASLGDFFSVLIIYLTILYLKKIKIKELSLMGILAGASLITRLSTLSAVITIPFSFIVKNYPKIKKTLKPIIIIIIIALLISGWSFVRNYALYGDFLAYNAMQLSSPPDDITIDGLFVLRLVGWTFITFWASFGRTNNVFLGDLTSNAGISIFSISYLLLFLLTVLSIFGLFKMYNKYRENKKIITDIQKKGFLIISFHLLLLIITFVRFNLFDFQPQGRYFFSAIPALAIFFTFGIYNLLNNNLKEKLIPIYSVIFILINIISIISIINFY